MPMDNSTELRLLDVVALKDALPDHQLASGQVGTIVELLAPEVYEVEFSDDQGQTYAMLPLHASQLLKLYYTPIDLIDQENPMSNTIHQYGQGDKVGGDKLQQAKIQNE
jgi:hypothetical protein